MSSGQNRQWIADGKEKAKERQHTHGRKPMRDEKLAAKAQQDYAFPGNAEKRRRCELSGEAFLPEYGD